MEGKIAATNLGTGLATALNLAQQTFSAAGLKPLINVLTGIGGILTPTMSLILTLLIGAVQPGYNPFVQTISELVYYPQGWMQVADFVVLGAWLVLLAIRFLRDFTRKTTTRVAALVIGLMGLAFFIIAVFPTNFPVTVRTVPGFIHDKAAQSICLLFPIACILMVREFKASNYWKKLAGFTTGAAAMGFVLGLVGGAVILTGASWLGLIERLIMLNAVVWLAVVSMYLVLWQQPRTNIVRATHTLQTVAQTVS